MGEATETALTVLVEKMNVLDTDKSSLTKKELGMYHLCVVHSGKLCLYVGI